MDNSNNSFSSSPQQIVYGGEKMFTGENVINFIAENPFIQGKITSNSLTKFFNEATLPSGQIITGDFSPMNLKSLQIDKLKYTSDETMPDVTGSKIILGRFIPYSQMTPAVLRVKGETIDILTGMADTDSDTGRLGYGTANTLYNKNYSQFIPYGVQNVYENITFARNTPKF